MNEDEYRELAKKLHHREGEIEIDGLAQVWEDDDDSGAYVEAWVWVPCPEEDKDVRP